MSSIGERRRGAHRRLPRLALALGARWPRRRTSILRSRVFRADGAQRVAMAAKAAGAERLLQMSAIGADAESESVYASTKGIGEQLVQDAFPGLSTAFGIDGDSNTTGGSGGNDNRK